MFCFSKKLIQLLSAGLFLSSVFFVKAEDLVSENIDKKTFEHLLETVVSGDARAQCDLGICYEYGDGTEKDLKKAFEWYKKAAEQNDAEAQFNLGRCYKFGEGTDIDLKKAFEWCKRLQAKDMFMRNLL